jgi:hypothetical protein
LRSVVGKLRGYTWILSGTLSGRIPGSGIFRRRSQQAKKRATVRNLRRYSVLIMLSRSRLAVMARPL